jgi:Domain of unknown function (DUF4382)
MLSSRRHLRSAFTFAAMFTAIGLAGCGSSCFVGFSNNGNGGAIVKVGDPPPTCSLSQASGAMRAVLLRSPICETCTPAVRVEHFLVTLRGIQVRSGATPDTNSPDWLELAPHLATEPRQIDLMGSSLPVILVDGAIVPAGSYREVRLQFLSDSPASAEVLPTENVCGEMRWNCLIRAGGQVQPLRLPGDVPELLIPSQNIENGSVVVLPDARMDLRLSLDPHLEPFFSGTAGWILQTSLIGHATVVRPHSSEAENSNPD